MSFQFRPAVRENVGLLIALAGASGSGKTFSALRLAQGMAAGKPIAFIDTEARRGLHYADKFKFLHADMRPPFRPENFVAGIRAAEQSGAGVVVIDSFSHEYDGEGGIMDWADELAEKGVKSPGNWKEPKGAHKRLMQALLQVRCHLIFCLRADEKIEIVRENGKTAVKPLGWMPICEKRFMYEMTASFTLIPSDPGKPQFALPHKLQDQHRGFFPPGKMIDETAGKALSEWAAGAAPAKEPETVGEMRCRTAPNPNDFTKDQWTAWLGAAKAQIAECKTLDDLTVWKDVNTSNRQVLAAYSPKTANALANLIAERESSFQ